MRSASDDRLKQPDQPESRLGARRLTAAQTASVAGVAGLYTPDHR